MRKSNFLQLWSILLVMLLGTVFSASAGNSKTYYSKAVATVATGSGKVYASSQDVALENVPSSSWTSPSSNATFNSSNKDGSATHTFWLFAKADDDAEFGGWFTDSGCTNWYSNEAKIEISITTTQTKSSSAETKTYYAKFSSPAPDAYHTTVSLTAKDNICSVGISETNSFSGSYSNTAYKQINATKANPVAVYYLFGTTNNPLYNSIMWYSDVACTQYIGSSEANQPFRYEARGIGTGITNFTVYAKAAIETTYNEPAEVIFTSSNSLISSGDDHKNEVIATISSNDGGNTYNFNISEIEFSGIKLKNLNVSGLTTTTNADGTKSIVVSNRKATIGDLQSDNSTVESAASGIKENGIKMNINAKFDEANKKLWVSATTEEISVTVVFLPINIGVVDIRLGNDFTQTPVDIKAIKPSAKNKYYFYNPDKGMWLQANNRNPDDFNTRLEMGTQSLDAAINLFPGGTNTEYTLDFGFSGNGTVNTENRYLDTGSGMTPWQFYESDTPGRYYIRSHYGNLGYIKTTKHAYNEEFLTYVLFNDNNHPQTWEIYTEEERFAIMNKMEVDLDNPYENLYDATFLIKAYEFENGNRREGAWQRTVDGNYGYGAGRDSYRCNSIYETWSKDNFELYQVIEGVPNGAYMFTMVGSYSPTGGDNVGDVNNQPGNPNMTVDHYNDWITNGPASVKGYVFANEERARLRSVYEAARTSNYEDCFKRKIQDDVWVSSWPTQFNKAFALGDIPGNQIEGLYVSEPVIVFVTDGVLRLGAGVQNGGGSVWLCLDKAHLYYGGQIPASYYQQPLLDKIAEVEAFLLTDDANNSTEGMIAALTTALNAAKAVTESTDRDVLGEALGNLTSALNHANVNARDLKAAMAFISDYNPAFSTQAAMTDAQALLVATTGVTQDGINSTYDRLRREHKMYQLDKSARPVGNIISNSVVGTDDNVAAICDPDQKYYVYNVGTGRWFCGGDDWGAHAAVGFPGIEVNFPADNFGTGHYNGFVTWLCNGDWGTSHKLGHNGYCDTGGNGWKFWRINSSSDIYTISKNGNDQGVNASNDYGRRDLLGFSEQNHEVVQTDRAGADNPYNQWIFVTKAQRLALLSGATRENPVDATFMIKMPGFNQRERVEGSNQSNEQLPWVCNRADFRYENDTNRHIILERNERHADFAVDVYNWDEFSLMQTIEGLPAGVYRVKVQGYYRDGGDEMADRDGERLASLVANGRTQPLRLPNSEPKVPWINGGNRVITSWHAIEAFQNGMYWNEVECIVGENGKLDLGIVKPAGSFKDGNALVFDNFRLEYLGAAPTDVTISYDRDNSYEVEAYAYANMKVNLNIKIKVVENHWNAITLPLNLSNELVKAIFGANAKVAELRTSGIDIAFETVATGIEAGKPCLVFVSGERNSSVIVGGNKAIARRAARSNSNVVETEATFHVENVKLDSDATPSTISIGSNSVTFQPNSYRMTTVGSSTHYFNTDKYILVPNKDNTTVAPFSGYFEITGTPTESEMNISIDDIPTGVENITVDGVPVTIYGIDGRIYSPDSKLRPGIYIINGEKVLVK